MHSKTHLVRYLVVGTIEDSWKYEKEEQLSEIGRSLVTRLLVFHTWSDVPDNFVAKVAWTITK